MTKAIIKTLLAKVLNTPLVIEEGTDGIWTYRKWSDGTAECWGSDTTTGTFTAWGNGFSHDIPPRAFPTGLFTEAPITIAMCLVGGVGAISSISANTGNKDSTPQVITFRPTSAGSSTQTFITKYYSLGKWK